MPQRTQLSPIQQAKKRMTENKQRQADMLASLGLNPEANQAQLSEKDAKVIAATLMELMKR